MVKELTKVIDVNSDLCVNCHACIAVCPIKYCNDGSRDTVAINTNACIACGECIKACQHGARFGIDDMQAFLAALSRKEKIVAIVAPAIAANFPHDYLNLNGWLKSLGVAAVFDVSFGAELTVRSYLEHVKNDQPKLVIAQPCPAVVNYVQLRHPELLPYLAPADSPMMHTIKMIEEYYPDYANHKIAVMSPCFAKRREFDEVGKGDFNITYQSLDAWFKAQKITLSRFPQVDYDNPSAERAVLFSTPGGLLQTAMRDMPGIERKTRKIEGPENVYHYLDHLHESLEDGTAPLLIDCLNCTMGCNGGTGTMNQSEPIDKIEARIEERNQQMQANYGKRSLFPANNRKRVAKVVSRHWKKGLYNRSYLNLADNYQIQQPSDTELKKIYATMEKFKDDDVKNCRSCGYNACETMAVAIHNGLNKRENCHWYQHDTILKEQEQIIKQKKTTENMSDMMFTMLDKSRDHMSDNQEMLQNVTVTLVDLEQANTTVVSKIEESTNNAMQSKEMLQKVNQQVQTTTLSIGKLESIVTAIDSISAQINLLALNAAIEAARAGEYGRGFSVVADEVRKLADESRKEAEKIAPFSQNLKTEFDVISKHVQNVTVYFEDYVQRVEDILSFSEEVSASASEVRQKLQQATADYQKLMNEELASAGKVKAYFEGVKQHANV